MLFRSVREREKVGERRERERKSKRKCLVHWSSPPRLQWRTSGRGGLVGGGSGGRGVWWERGLVGEGSGGRARVELAALCSRCLG